MTDDTPEKKPETSPEKKEENPSTSVAKPTDAQVYPVLLLRDIVVFPHMIVPLFVGREKSIHALEDVLKDGRPILLVTQKDPTLDDPTANDVYYTGTLSSILNLLRLPDGTIKVLIEGIDRVAINSFTDRADFFEAAAQIIHPTDMESPELKPLVRSVLTQFEQYVKLNRRIPPEILISLNQIEDAEKISDIIASHLTIKVAEKLRVLETPSIVKRLELLFSYMEEENDVLQVEKKIRRRVKKQMEKSQREYYLNEQMKAIQKELNDGEEDEFGDIEKKIKRAGMSKEAKEKAKAELKKLRSMSPMSAEATVIRNYLDWLTSLPWKKKSQLSHDLAKAQDIMNKDHYGLEKVKERILEHLAVQLKTNQVKGPILCLVGPPGVGKTSLGQSIAKATGRTFVRASLGGMRDEAEIRGHRRTYIGSMPGKIIQSIRKAKTSNPLFLLDEIDKLGADWRGDPSSALLEVLDPEQNATFNDHYLEVDYNLSDVMFVTTANTLKMPAPLLDRMEIIRLSGYTEDEKIGIARGHLIRKKMLENGLKEDEWSVSDEALRQLIRLYTKESGVRNLEREIGNLTRKATKELLLGKTKKVSVTPKNLEKYAGVPRYTFGTTDKEDRVGVTTGLAWTEVGGELLSIEALTMPGKGRTTLTGQLGDVMKESVEIARSFVRSKAVAFGIKPTMFEKADIHVHVPEGATPKDGPSAGVTMCTSLVSILTGIPVRKDVAMTGEITLLGKVLPIGGLKEKLLAALRGGVKTVLIPKDNAKDLADVPANLKKGLEIIPVSSAEEVLARALTKPLTPITWTEEDEKKAEKEANGKDD